MKFLPLLLLLVGCADLKPYVGYTHLDPTPLHNDDQAYDFGCGGLKYRKAIDLSVGACANVRGGGEFFRFDAEYVWNDIGLND